MEFSLFCKTVSGSLSGLSVEQYTQYFRIINCSSNGAYYVAIIYGLTIVIVVFGIQTD